MTKVEGFFVYSYMHDDDQQGWTDAELFQKRDHNGHREPLPTEMIEAARKAVTACGWEGDGHFEVMMVPPFFTSLGDNYWFPIFHVKQINNGISWIASENELATDNLTKEASRRPRT